MMWCWSKLLAEQLCITSPENCQAKVIELGAISPWGVARWRQFRPAAAKLRRGGWYPGRVDFLMETE